MDKEKFYTAKNINEEIEALDKLGVELHALNRKYRNGSVEREMVDSFIKQIIDKAHELQGKFEEV